VKEKGGLELILRAFSAFPHHPDVLENACGALRNPALNGKFFTHCICICSFFFSSLFRN
jgi:hypothetical protein